MAFDHLKIQEQTMLGLENLDVLDGLDDLMSENAEIDLASCSVARGCGGQSFLVQFAKRLLGKRGGTVKASPTAVSGWLPGVLKQSPEGSDWIYLQMDPLGKTIRWSGPAYSRAQCVDRFNKQIEHTNKLREQFAPCGRGTPFEQMIERLRATSLSIQEKEFRGFENTARMISTEREYESLMNSYSQARCVVD